MEYLFRTRIYINGTSTSYSVLNRDMDNYRFETLRNYIFNILGKNITRQELASYICLSMRQTDRVIRAQTGVSIHNFIMKERMNAAKNLPHTTALSLSNIAEQTGLSSEYHLSSCLKKVVGVIPSEYRKTIR